FPEKPQYFGKRPLKDEEEAMKGRRFNFGVISILVTLLVVSIAFMSGCTEQPSTEEPSIPTPPTEPVPGALTTQGYVYDDELGYGFDYPGGWEFHVYEGEFVGKNIEKVVSFEKKIPYGRGQVSVELELIVKPVTDLQEVKDEFKQELERSGIPILNEATISVNNIDGYDILSGIPTWKLRKVAFFANGMAYIFKYSSQEEFYRMYEETFNNVINSFVIE
ncbi:unnamed protein product, partial [marine sediment metagenome]